VNPNFNPNVNYTNPVSYGAPPASPGRPKNRTLLIGLIVLVILVSLGAILVPYEKTQIDNANATATVSTHQTSVARDATGTVTTQNAHATATAQIYATATAAVVAANPNPYLPNQGTLVAFNKTPDSSWLRSEACSLRNGTFTITNSVKETVYYCTGGASYDNFAYDIQMTILQGDCGGIVFRIDATEGHKYYMFNVCQNGYYSIDSNQGAALHFNPIKSGDMAPGVHTGLKSINLIGVVARGPNLSLYVNTQLVASITDTAYGSGQLGVVAWDAANPTTITFANQRVWKL
jgi:type II secretory pathway pseudopilin PulG